MSLPEASQDYVGCPAARALTAPGQDQKVSLPEVSQDCEGCPAAGAPTAPGQDPKNVSLKPPKTMWAALQPVHLQHQARTKKRLPEVSQDCEGCPAASALTAPGQDPKSVSP